jgi:HEAT repeat protein
MRTRRPPKPAHLAQLVRLARLAVLPVLLGAGAGHPSVARAEVQVARQPRSVQASAVYALLQAEHPRVDAALLQRIGPDVQAILIEQVTAPRQRSQVTPVMRQRALGWLQFYPNPSSRAVLLDALRHRDGEESLRLALQRVALRALAVAFGAAELAVLREHLQHPNLYVREAAAYALGDVDDRRVRGILEDQLGRDPELAVREAIEAALRKVSQRGDTAR